MKPPRPYTAGEGEPPLRSRLPRRFRTARRLLAAAVVVLALLAVSAFHLGKVEGASTAIAEAPEPGEPGTGGPDEYKLKAAFLYNFVRFTTWPEEALGGADDPIVVLVIGEDRFEERLDEVFDGKVLHDRRIDVRRALEVPEKLEAHLVFACGLSEKQERVLLARCEQRAILTMGDRKGFARSGACANFFIHEKHVRFQVNPDEVTESGLSISAKLLKLAEIVETERDEESQGGDE